MPFPHEATGDSPVRRRGPVLLVCGPVLDPWYLVGLAELTPPDAIVSVEDKRGMSGSGMDALLLALSVEVRSAPGNSLGMESHAPAAAEDSVVALDERRESGPGRLAKSLDLVWVGPHGPEPKTKRSEPPSAP